MIKNIKIQQLIENYESANNPADISFKKYVERESQYDLFQLTVSYYSGQMIPIGG